MSKLLEAIARAAQIKHEKEIEIHKDNTALEGTIYSLLHHLDPNPDRQGLQETPARVARAWREWTRGYVEDPAEILKTFEDGAENYDQMVIVKDVQFHSHCEHHLAPFFGSVSVAYIPAKHIVGLSKLARLVDMFAHRLQVQERMTNQIADAITKRLQPLGCGVLVKATHLCIESRGIKRVGSETVTSALRGVFMDATVKSEFLSLA